MTEPLTSNLTTWTWNLGTFDPFLWQGPRDKARIKDQFKQIEDQLTLAQSEGTPTLFFAQEASFGKIAKKLLRRLRKLPGIYISSQALDNRKADRRGHLFGSGLALIATFPLDPKNCFFADYITDDGKVIGTGFQRWANKGFSGCKIGDRETLDSWGYTDVSALVFVNSHHQPYPANRPDAYDSIQLAQAQFTLDRLSTDIAERHHIDLDSSVVFWGGDFNAPPGSPALKAIEASGYSLHNDAVTPSWGEGDNAARIDHIAVRVGSKLDKTYLKSVVGVANDFEGSDHDPVVAHVEASDVPFGSSSAVVFLGADE